MQMPDSNGNSLGKRTVAGLFGLQLRLVPFHLGHICVCTYEIGRTVRRCNAGLSRERIYRRTIGTGRKLHEFNRFRRFKNPSVACHELLCLAFWIEIRIGKSEQLFSRRANDFAMGFVGKYKVQLLVLDENRCWQHVENLQKHIAVVDARDRRLSVNCHC